MNVTLEKGSYVVGHLNDGVSVMVPVETFMNVDA